MVVNILVTMVILDSGYHGYTGGYHGNTSGYHGNSVTYLVQ